MSTYTDASLIYYPSGYKAGKAYSLKPTDGSGDLDFTRASNGTRVNSAGLVEDVPWNLASYSETFNNAAWVKTRTTITANTTTAPNGTLTADTFTLTPGPGAGVYQAVNGVSNNYTISVYAKYVSGDKYLYFFSPSNSQGAKVWFDIQNGTVSNQLSGFTGTIEDAGNGWYKCSMYNTTQAVLNYIQIQISTTNSNTTLSNNSVSYFWGAQVNIGATAKPYFPTTDRLNVPRIDFTSGCGTLLLEPQRSNLQTQSNGFLSNWTKNDVNTSVGESTLISGETTTLMTETATNAVHRVVSVSTASLTIGSVYTISFYAKANGTRNIGLRTGFTGSSANIIFNPNTQTAVSVPAGFTTNITAANDGYYRYSITATAGAASDLISVVMFDGTSLVYTGTTESIYISAIQTEVGSFSTSYIPTLGTAVTRTQDSASKSGISSLIGQTEGTIFLDTKYLSAGATSSPRWFKVFGVSDEIGLAINGVNSVRAIINGISDTITTAPKTDLGVKIAFAYNGTGVVLFINGVEYALPFGGSQIMSSLDSILFDAGANPQFQQADVNSFMVFKTRLSDTELAALTTL